MARVTGTAGVDTLNGTTGNDTIDALAGADTMIGGLGYDTYYVDNVLDVIIEDPAEGTEKVYSSVSFTLDDNVEHLTLTGTANINATGNVEDNILTGNRGNNALDGDQGRDTMNGGAGNDTYVINIFSTDGINDKDGVGDVIIDSSGIDSVVGAFAGGAGVGDLIYIMQKGLENATFDWTATDCTVTGNSGKNIISVSDGDDTLYGMAGNDTLSAGDGDDTLDGGKGADTMTGGDGANVYVVDNKDDVIIDVLDDSADDTVKDTAEVYASYVMAGAAEVEIIRLMGAKSIKLTASDADNKIFGNEGTNSIHGGTGDDWIEGGGGRDKLWGDLGADTFYFDVDTALEKPISIMDFDVADGDILDISDILVDYDNIYSITNWLRISDKGDNSIVEVDTDGAGVNGENWTLIATLYGVNGLTGETVLLNNGNVIAEV